jgi:GT2 family glycosyltransferase
MTANHSLSRVATLLSRLDPDLLYVQLPLGNAVAGHAPLHLSLLTTDANALVAQMGLAPVRDTAYCSLFQVRNHQDTRVQVHQHDQGYLPRELADALLAQRVSEALPDPSPESGKAGGLAGAQPPVAWSLLPEHASLASTYCRWLHRPAQHPLWESGPGAPRSLNPAALQNLARTLARLNAIPCKPQDETVTYHTGAARCLVALCSGSVAKANGDLDFDADTPPSLPLQADARPAPVHWLQPFLRDLTGRLLLLGPEGAARDATAQFLLDAGCDVHLTRQAADLQPAFGKASQIACKWINEAAWADNARQGFDAVVVQDLGGWCLQTLTGPAFAGWLASLGPQGQTTRASRAALLKEGLDWLATVTSPGAKIVVQQPALQRHGPLHLGSFEPDLAMAQGAWQVLACYAAVGDSHAPRLWASTSLLASPIPALMNLLVASTGPNSSNVPDWAHALRQGQGPQLASAWAWVLCPNPEAPATPHPTAPTQALAYVLGPQGSETVTAQNSALVPGVSTALHEFFKVGTGEAWTFSQWAAVLRRYLEAVQTLFPDPARADKVPLQATDVLPVSWCHAMPDNIAFGADGNPMELALGQASTPSPHLPSDRPPSAASFVLATLLRVLECLPQMGAHEHARRFTRLQWLENLLAEASLPWLAHDFAAAGLPASAWAGDALLPTPMPAPALQARDQTIADLEIRVHATQTERNVAQFELDQTRAMARTLTADVRRTVTEEVTQEVSAAITIRVSEAVAMGYEGTLSWRVTRPLRQAKALLQKWRGRGGTAPEQSLAETSQPTQTPVDWSAAAVQHEPPPEALSVEASNATKTPAAPLVAGTPQTTPDLHFYTDPAPAAPSKGQGRWDYGIWVAEFDTIDRFECCRMANQLAQRPELPAIALLCAPLAEQWPCLVNLLADLKSQAFTYWSMAVALPEGVVVADDLLAQLRAEPRVTLVAMAAHATFEERLALLQNAAPASTQWLGWVPADARLSLKALAAYTCALHDHPAWHLVYADVDTLDDAGCRTAPNFKPDWNPALFFSSALAPNPSHSLVSGLVLARRQLWAPALAVQYSQHLASIPNAPGNLATASSQGGTVLFNLFLVLQALAKGFHDDLGRALSAHQAIGHVACVTQHLPACMLDLPERAAGLALLQGYFEQVGQAVEVSLTAWGARVQYPIYPLGSPSPLVSIVIPTRNNPKLLAQCVGSLLEKTNYAAYEILVVDNGSDTPEAMAQLRQLATNPLVRVIRDSSPFNYSDLNNAAVAKARGQFIALVNDDIEVIEANWLSEMVSHASQPDVGVVGAKLLYPNGTVQHAGVFLVGSLSWHAHRHLGQDEAGYCARAQLVQNYSCVTAACLVVRKSLYEKMGGLDAQHFTVGWNDTDFCLKVLKAGYRNVWTPHAILLHHESATRGQDQTPEKAARAAREYRTMQKRWGDAMNHDPAYNDNLTCGYEDFSLAWPPRGTLFKNIASA